MGYALDTGNPEDDLALAKNRVVSVRHYFESQGISTSNIQYAWRTVSAEEIAHNRTLKAAELRDEDDIFDENRKLTSYAEVTRYVYLPTSPIKLGPKAPVAAMEDGLLGTQRSANPLIAKQAALAKKSKGEEDSYNNPIYLEKRRRAILATEKLREPTALEKAHVVNDPKKILSGNTPAYDEPGKAIALDTKVEERYGVQDALPHTTPHDRAVTREYSVNKSILASAKGDPGLLQTASHPRRLIMAITSTQRTWNLSSLKGVCMMI